MPARSRERDWQHEVDETPMPGKNIPSVGDQGWAVAVEGTDGATSHYPSQEEAIAAGTEKATQDKV